MPNTSYDPNQPFPAIPKPLLDALDALNPNLCPDPEWTDREIWMRAGARRLVNRLLAQYDIQQLKD